MTTPDHEPTPVQASEERTWLLPILGALAALALAGVAYVWWHTDLPAVDDPAVVAEEPQDGGMPAEPVAEATPEPVAEQGTQSEPAPEAPTASEAEPSPTTPTVVLTNCTFVNGERPQVGEKYILTCTEGTYLGKAEYKGGGTFVFSDFEEQNPPK